MIKFKGIDHHSVISSDLQLTRHFYETILGLKINPNRPQKLPFDGVWFEVGQQAIHILQLSNPDATSQRPEHGGRDRHVALVIEELEPLLQQLKKHDIQFTQSKSGRAAIFLRDPDDNAIEVIQAN